MGCFAFCTWGDGDGTQAAAAIAIVFADGDVTIDCLVVHGYLLIGILIFLSMWLILIHSY
jgi:hypothetical protein